MSVHTETTKMYLLRRNVQREPWNDHREKPHQAVAVRCFIRLCKAECAQPDRRSILRPFSARNLRIAHGTEKRHRTDLTDPKLFAVRVSLHDDLIGPPPRNHIPIDHPLHI